MPCCSTARSSGCSTNRSCWTRRATEGSAEARDDGETNSYVELVVSSSKTLVEKSRQEIIDLALTELREFFPGARDANLVKATVIKEVHATYSPRPGIESFRPSPETVWPRIFLAGDWTATGWPATMEGAVRSGYARRSASLESPDGAMPHFWFRTCRRRDSCGCSVDASCP